MDLSRRKINKWGKGGEENIIRAKASAEKREKLCVEMSPALPSHVKATQEIRTNLPTKQKAAEPEPQERLRCNSPLRSERHLFPSNGSISGFEKVIWKTRHARTHSCTTQSMAVNHSGFSWYMKSQNASSVTEKIKNHTVMSRKDRQDYFK